MPSISDTVSESKVIEIALEVRTLAQITMEWERQYLEHILTETGGNKAQAARIARVSETTIREKVSRYTVKTTVKLT